MPSLSSILSLAGLLAMAHGHSIITNAQGVAGSPASVGFAARTDVARNCTNVSPCQQDTNIIRDAEIKAGTVGNCGRTELDGIIDIGQETESAINNNAVTQVKAGQAMTLTIHQVNADGAGPYTCDLLTGANNDVVSQTLDVANDVPGANGLSQVKEQAFKVQVTMPSNLTCTGASTGNICTVRCRNAALAGPFGGCVAVQQGNGANARREIATSEILDKISSRMEGRRGRSILLT
ncbi:hypothetical protein GGR56DRAFT_536969 [Xylariaceae sp. FL0804]|nr:hypothetical protein GGR56DRAFT_536969 [Xylariaceae sp. FL0804]